MKILAIDFAHLWFRNWMATGGSELSEASRRTLQTVATIRAGYDRVAILLDSGPSFRRAIDPAYKADREKQPAPFYEQMRRTVDRLRGEGCSVFAAPEVDMSHMGGPATGLFAEADDLCASLAQWCMDPNYGHLLDIYGGDKDLCQCIDDAAGIRVIHPDKGPITASYVLAKFGIAPPRIVDWLALAGDTSDNYKPFPKWSDAEGDHPGIGDKGAVALIKAHGTAIEIIALLDAKDEDDNPAPPWGEKSHTTKAMRRGLPTPYDAVRRGLNLATLRRDLPVDFSPLLAEPVYATLSKQAQTWDEAKATIDSDRTPILPGEPKDSRDTTVAETRAIEADLLGATDGHAAALAVRPAAQLTTFGARFAAADDMMKLANRFYDARMFGTMPNAEAIFTVMWLAQERGESMGHALVNSYVTKPGKPPGYLATYLAARVKASTVCKVFRIIETERDHATVEYQRVDDPEPLTYRFDLQEAIDAGWDRDSKDSPWKTRPRAMCRAAALREAARAFFFDVVSGMADADEFANGG